MAEKRTEPAGGRTVSGAEEGTVQWQAPRPAEKGPAPDPEGTVDNRAGQPPQQPTHRGADEQTIAQPPARGDAQDPESTRVSAVDSSRGSPPDQATLDGQTQVDDRQFSQPPNIRRRTQLGRFEIKRVLGEGAFGTVYLAHDPQLDREVALKVAKTGALPRESDRLRFLREARAAAQLRHPNIVPVYEFGQLDHSIYIAYQFVAGESLKSVLRREAPLPRERTIEILAKLAGGLHYAHLQGIVHRDMKPDNVLIDERGEPHITDFGCARRDEGEIRATVEGTIMGTPAYMSPEQATGRSNEADGRSDVWSLGVMLEEMLTGILPFQGTLTEVLVQIQEREPKPLRQLDHSIPKDLETICAKCLAKRPGERFATAGDLEAELQRFRRGEPILSRPINVFGRTWRWAKRNPAVASLLLTVFLTLLSGASISTALFLRGRHQQWLRTVAQIDSLRTASPQSVPYLLSHLQPFRRDVVPRIAAQLAATEPGSEQARLRAALVTLGDRSLADLDQHTRALVPDLLAAEPEEFALIRDALRPHMAAHVEQLWPLAREAGQPKAIRFRAACALALFAPDAPQWQELAGDVVGQLVTENRAAVPFWVQALAPVRDALRPGLEQQFRAGEDAEKRAIAAAVLANLYADQLPQLVELALDAEPPQLAELLRQLRHQSEAARAPLRRVSETVPTIVETIPTSAELAPSHAPSATQVANAEVALLALGTPEPVWRRLGSQQQPAIRAWVIERLGAVGVDPAVIKQRLAVISDSGEPLEMAGLLLALGRFDPGQLYLSERAALAPQLVQLHTTHPHPAVHSASQWLLQRWGYAAEVAASSASSGTAPGPLTEDSPQWQRTAAGHTLVVLQPAESFAMGAPRSSSRTLDVTAEHRRRMPRRFAIATREVTVADFEQFEMHRLAALTQALASAKAEQAAEKVAELELALEDLQRRRLNRRPAADPQQPIVDVTWFEAAAYCYWLGEQEGLASDQQCYPPIERIEELFARFQPLLIAPEKLDLPGYRLPTTGEWEYAARAGSTALRAFGDVRLTAQYAWTADNAGDRLWPTGQLKPNALGLFDTLGNAFEWCHDWKLDLAEPTAEGWIVDGSDSRRGVLRELRGGSFKEFASEVHSSVRSELRPEQGDLTVGFRVARTVVGEPGHKAGVIEPGS